MADQEYIDSLFIPSDQRENSKAIIAKRSDLVQFDGGRLGPSQNSATLVAGTVLGLASSGGDSGFWKPYNASNSDGSQVAKGVLAQDAAVDASGNGSEIRIIKDGILFSDFLIAPDTGWIAQLSTGIYVEHGTNLVHIRA